MPIEVYEDGKRVTSSAKFAYKTSREYLDEPAPVINTYYEIFHKTGGVILDTLVIRQDNTAVTAEDIDVLITIDGRTIFYDHNVNPMSSGHGHTIFIVVASAQETETGACDANSLQAADAEIRPLVMTDPTQPARGFGLKGHDIKVEVRQVSTIDAGERIRAWATVEHLQEV